MTDLAAVLFSVDQILHLSFCAYELEIEIKIEYAAVAILWILFAFFNFCHFFRISSPNTFLVGSTCHQTNLFQLEQIILKPVVEVPYEIRS